MTFLVIVIGGLIIIEAVDRFNAKHSWRRRR